MRAFVVKISVLRLFSAKGRIEWSTSTVTIRSLCELSKLVIGALGIIDGAIVVGQISSTTASR